MMQKEERYAGVMEYFTRSTNIKTELNYETPYQLLLAVILSAQCTDKRVNLVTPALFERFPNTQELANSHFDEVFPYLKSISYPNNKTKYIIAASKMIINDFAGTIPSQVDLLQQLPGVGRKSAHAIAAILYNMPTLAVDTHVMRVSRRIGLVDERAKTPIAVEKQLVAHIKQEDIGKFNHWLVMHGRYTCLARKPKCNICQISSYCLYFEKIQSNREIMNINVCKLK